MNNISSKLVLIAVGMMILLWPVWGLAANDDAADYGIVLNLEEAVTLGIEKSPRIKARQYAVESSDSERKSARSQFFPQISAGGGYTSIRSTYASGPTDSDYLEQDQHHWNVRLVQTVFAGMTIFNSYQKAKIEKEVSELEKEKEERELIKEIQYYFLNFLKAKEDVKSLEGSIERLEVSVESAKKFYEARLVPYVDVLQAEVELEETLQTLGKTRNEVNILRTRLNSLLGFAHDQHVEYRGNIKDIQPRANLSVDQTIRTALKKRTDFDFIRKNIESAQKEMKIAKGRNLPKVNFEMSYSERTNAYLDQGTDMYGERYDRDQTNHYWNTGINVQWEIFSGGRDYYRSQSMDYEIKRLRELLQDTENSITSEAKTAFMRLKEARERFTSTRKAIAAAKENYAMQEHRFKKRVGTVQELLTAQVQLTRADVNRNQALLDHQLALSELCYAMGEKNYGLD